jgi:hypothetical protein
MTRFLITGLFLTTLVLGLSSAAPAQDPCSDQGPGCRLLTSTEVKGLMDRFSALKAT